MGSSGLMAAFKSGPTQPLQVAWGVRNGLTAAFLAGGGHEGYGRIIEDGFFPAYLGHDPLVPLHQPLEYEYAVLGSYLKAYPGCRHLHPAIDAFAQVEQAHQISFAQIKAIRVGTYRIAVETEIHDLKNRGDAYFNLPYALAARAVLGNNNYDSFAERHFADLRLLGLMKKIEVRIDPEIERRYPKQRGARVEVDTIGGRSLAGLVEHPLGEPENPLPPAFTRAKFREAAGAFLAEDEMERVAGLLDLTGPPEGPPPTCSRPCGEPVISEVAEMRDKEWVKLLAADFEARGRRKPEFQSESRIPLDDLYDPEALSGTGFDPQRILGKPGGFPFTRGIYPSMYRGSFWIMGQYAGFGNPEATNERFKYLLEKGQTALALALDLPTQLGLESDHELADGEVGKAGVAINSLKDMEDIFAGIPLNKAQQIFTTANAIGPIMLALFLALAERQGVHPSEYHIVLQNDILKEYVARGAYIFPPPLPEVRHRCRGALHEALSEFQAHRGLWFPYETGRGHRGARSCFHLIQCQGLYR